MAQTPKRRKGKATQGDKPQADNVPLIEAVQESTCTSRGLQTIYVIRCNKCDTDKVHKNGTGSGFQYFKCLRCKSRFKVRVVDADAKHQNVQKAKSRNGGEE